MQRGKVENATEEMLRSLDQLMERKEDEGMYLLWVPLIGDVRTLMTDEAYAQWYLDFKMDEFADDFTLMGDSNKAWSACGRYLRSCGRFTSQALVDIARILSSTKHQQEVSSTLCGYEPVCGYWLPESGNWGFCSSHDVFVALDWGTRSRLYCDS
ncbi:hypothetical protein Tco_0801254 [Tanacetum coccineum]|uniref:Uncharacterized protein n=1 Tax=Tanacetum coccineum TaxID=301880 RepID=A0ABQ4ZXR9_9ASTR